jgi:hypothetical protein
MSNGTSIKFAVLWLGWIVAASQEDCDGFQAGLCRIEQFLISDHTEEETYQTNLGLFRIYLRIQLNTI